MRGPVPEYEHRYLMVRERYVSCPAVSQICVLTVSLLSRVTSLLENSTAMVGMMLFGILSLVKQ